jgi:hypothetical protein
MKIKTEGDSEFERFERVMNKLLSVSHEEMQRRLATDPRGHVKSNKKKRKSAKASASRDTGAS